MRVNETVGVVNCAKNPKNREPMISGRRTEIERNNEMKNEHKIEIKEKILCSSDADEIVLI